jgi:hypothetical protein
MHHDRLKFIGTRLRSFGPFSESGLDANVDPEADLLCGMETERFDSNDGQSGFDVLHTAKAVSFKC